MKRVIFIGQAPARPGSKHAIAGSYIRPWLYELGLAEATISEFFQFYALINSFPGMGKTGHLRPTPEQIMDQRPALIKKIQAFQPNIIVPVGGMAIAELMASTPAELSEIIGNTYTANPYNCLPEAITLIPLPHPSGRSTWLHKHNDLLDRALTQLAANLELSK
jgi:uracil-DNA glycosylase